MTTQSGRGSMALGGLRLIIVEDEAMVAMLLESLLEELGCKVVHWAANVPAAMKAIEGKDFDGALLDVNLAGTTVYPVASALAERNVPFVFVTGYGLIDTPDARFADAHVLKKPFQSAQLAAALAAGILRQPLHRF